jgi:hypothetical protein
MASRQFFDAKLTYLLPLRNSPVTAKQITAFTLTGMGFVIDRATHL